MKRGPIIWIVVILVVVLGAWAVLRSPSDGPSPNPALTGDLGAPSGATPSDLTSLSFEDYQGNTVALSDFAGQPLVVNAWASWCPFCVNELPDFVAAQETFGDSVVIVAVNRAESARTAEQYIQDLGLQDSILFVQDPGDLFYRTIGGFSMPETVFIAADGELNFHKRGVMKKEEIEQRIQAILQ